MEAVIENENSDTPKQGVTPKIGGNWGKLESVEMNSWLAWPITIEVGFIGLRTDTKLIEVVTGWLKIFRPPIIKLDKRSLPANWTHEVAESTVIAMLVWS